MARKELVDYISRHLKKGTSLQKIKDHLAKAGHSHESIEAAAQEATGNHFLVKHKGWVAGGVVVLIIIGSISLYVFQISSTTTTSSADPTGECQGYCLFELARGTQNFSLCTRLNGTNQSLCFSQEPDICEIKISFGLPGSEQCFFDKAQSEKNAALCSLISDAVLRTDCFEMSYTQNETSFINLILTTGRSLCNELSLSQQRCSAAVGNKIPCTATDVSCQISQALRTGSCNLVEDDFLPLCQTLLSQGANVLAVSTLAQYLVDFDCDVSQVPVNPVIKTNVTEYCRSLQGRCDEVFYEPYKEACIENS